jgi:hypothetical protein
VGGSGIKKDDGTVWRRIRRTEHMEKGRSVLRGPYVEYNLILYMHYTAMLIMLFKYDPNNLRDGTDTYHAFTVTNGDFIEHS